MRHKPRSEYHVDTLQVELSGLRGVGWSGGAEWSATGATMD